MVETPLDTNPGSPEPAIDGALFDELKAQLDAMSGDYLKLQDRVKSLEGHNDYKDVIKELRELID